MKKTCKNHQWASLLAKVGKRIIPSSAKICLNCGLLKTSNLKIGEQTIRISRNRLDMGGKPIKNVSKIDISERLRIPAGADLYD